MRTIHIVILFIAFSHSVLAQNATRTEISLTPIASGIMAPVSMACPNDQSGRIFICEQTGKIRIIKNGKISDKPFLDLSGKLDRMGKMYSEKGLLGLAFHPQYKQNGKFYVYYSAPESDKGYDHKSIVAEYKVSGDAEVADAGSEKIILEIKQPESNHNGGQLAFGPDGYLYIGSGDGGGGGDQHGVNGNGQDLSTLLGKILRIDVSTTPYTIPADNPFKSVSAAKPEVWAYGLRNPWRFSFDRKSGVLFCGDVGQNRWEEVDIIKKGGNYGWRFMEGTHCFNPQTNCPQGGLEMPVAEYDHNEGLSITGGYVYRGPGLSRLQGRYIFGDWKGKLFFLETQKGAWQKRPLFVKGKKDNDAGVNINSFGEDETGRVYLLTQKFTGTFAANGTLYLIE
jgi:glucose/arabinose dehydrogenase